MGKVIVQITTTLTEIAAIISDLPSGAQSKVATIQTSLDDVTRTQVDNNIYPTIQTLRSTYPNASIVFVYQEKS